LKIKSDHGGKVSKNAHFTRGRTFTHTHTHSRTHTGQSLPGAAPIHILDSDRLLPAAQYVYCHLERCH
jgi:hypothetical protein